MKKNIEQQIKQQQLQLLLYQGKVLMNHTYGFVYSDSKGKQVKINCGKNRKGKDFSFSNPQYWRVLSTFEGIIVKLGLYKLISIKFKK